MPKLSSSVLSLVSYWRRWSRIPGLKAVDDPDDLYLLMPMSW